MTRRDAYIISGFVLIVAFAAYWLLLLSPKRSDLDKVDKKVTSAQQALDQEKQHKLEFAAAQLQFPRLYASVAKLGKAVPTSDDVPSLLVQLNHAARLSSVDFGKIEVKSDRSAGNGGPSSSTPPPSTGSTGSASGSSSSGSSSGASGKSGGSSSGSSSSATNSSGSSQPGQQGSTSSSGQQGTSNGASSSTAQPGTPGSTSTGATSGAATPIGFSYTFNGNYFQLESLISRVTRMVNIVNHRLVVTGRLVVINGVTLDSGSVQIDATAYELPAGQSLFMGASPEAPAGLTPGTPRPAGGYTPGSSAPTPPPAVVSKP